LKFDGRDALPARIDYRDLTAGQDATEDGAADEVFKPGHALMMVIG